MENEFYTDEFEQLLKEKADQFRMYPSKRVWSSIYNNLHPSRRWPSVVMSLLLISSLMLIGYLNTSDNSIITRQINNNPVNSAEVLPEINNTKNADNKNQISDYPKAKHQPKASYSNAFENIITPESDFFTYTVVKSNRPDYLHNSPAGNDASISIGKPQIENSTGGIIQTLDTYIKTNRIFADVTAGNKKVKINPAQTTDKLSSPDANTDNDETSDLNKPVPVPLQVNNSDINNLTAKDKKVITKINQSGTNTDLTNEEKAWIENYAWQSMPVKNKWKNNLSYQFYITPAVNYRKLTSKSKGSTTTPFTSADINNVISQKPGFGIEAGAGLTYTLAKRLQLKGGLQFNYTNYNIAADQTNHPVTTTILLNDPVTGHTYYAARTTTTSNAYNTTALQPVTLHNRTYQISMPLGFAYKLSSENNVDWFAGASVQPTYIFGGNAHIISSDLKSYVSDPSSISTWNLNFGFETYMNFKLGTYNLQVGPQVRYQVFSTYRKELALIEKPYAVGLKFGLTKGF